MVRSDARGRLDLAEMRAERESAYARPAGHRRRGRVTSGDRYRVFWENGSFTQMQEFTNEKDARFWRKLREDRGQPARIVHVHVSRRARAHTRSPPRSR